MANRLSTPKPKDRNRSDSIQSFVSSIFSSTSNVNSSTNLNDSEESIILSPSPLSKCVTTTSIQSDDDQSTDFLQYIDPRPASPPEYNDINVNNKNKISFPIWENHTTSINPPTYTPTIYNYTIISMRTEFDSPYCKLPQFKSKVWQNFIVEINSTQINLYNIHPKLTKHIPNYSDGTIPSGILSSFQRKQAHQFDIHDFKMILDLIQNDPKQYLNSTTLHDPYSLQYAKCGLPLDFLYRKFVSNLNGSKANEFNLDLIPHDKVILNLIKSTDHKYLRVRLEDKQFLWKFVNVETMLNWFQFINIGINVSLDLDLREFPNYRVVPRRRSNQYRDYHSTTSLSSYDPSSSSSSTDIESLGSSLSSLEIDEDDNNDEENEKYCPIPKVYTYEKFLNESIRCIKPFAELKTWQNRIIVIQTKEPSFTTVNLPIYFHSNESSFKVKNHSLRLTLLNDQNNLVDLDHDMVMSWNDVNTSRII